LIFGGVAISVMGSSDCFRRESTAFAATVIKVKV